MGATLPKEKLDDQLTCNDIELIKISWDSVKDKKTIGVNTMIRYI
jgi:hypothetical protein